MCSEIIEKVKHFTTMIDGISDDRFSILSGSERCSKEFRSLTCYELSTNDHSCKNMGQ